jgi:DNA-binding transcriptional MerR regulator
MPGGEDVTDSGAGPDTGRKGRADRADRADQKEKASHRSSGSARQTGGRKRTAPQQGELIPDGKLYYRIGEVATITRVKAHVLRYWETEFRWMAPPKSRSRQRLYRRKDIEMILVIKRLLYEERYTIAGARQQLRELGLAKALEGGSVRSAEDSDDVAAANMNGAGDPVIELRAGYRLIRSELESIRELL